MITQTGLKSCTRVFGCNILFAKIFWFIECKDLEFSIEDDTRGGEPLIIRLNNFL